MSKWRMVVDDGSTLTVDREMGGGRPPPDPIAMERARARAESALFGCADPPRLGRYTIDEPLASGGMGVVFGAYDPDLDRRVALKVLHLQRTLDLEAGQRRLALEARALARLDHPNIVKVHDVLTIDRQVVIVMELVAGVTLDAWTHAEDRPWQEILAAYIQAGDGLAAAHAVGIVHRDFKPSNAIFGDDGRVRVLDFGIARIALDEVTEPFPAPARARDLDVHTATGVAMGTLVYAAPEQLQGSRVSDAADQFSFCVALHRALEGVPPFAGASVDTLTASISLGDVRYNARRRLPSWLRIAIRRGLELDPARRHASMSELLRELRRARGWKRWRAPVAAAALVTATALVARAASPAASSEACDGGKAALARVWNDAVRSSVTRFQSPQLDTLASRWLDGWSTTHRSTCRSRRRGAISASLADRATTCLQRRLRDFESAVTVLGEGERPSPDRAIEVLAALPQPTMCADTGWLQSNTIDPPTTAATAARVEATRDRLAISSASYRAGRVTAAFNEARLAVQEARALAYGPLLVEALLAEGALLVLNSELAAAEPILAEAGDLALAHDMISAAVEAGARRIFTYRLGGGIARMKEDLKYLDALSKSPRVARFARILLLHNIGTVYVAADELEHARTYYRLAEHELGDDLPDAELICVDRNLAETSGDAGERERFARRALERTRFAYGDHHVRTLESRILVAQATSDAKAALRSLDEVCAAYRVHYPDLPRRLVTCSLEASFLAWLLAEPDTQSRLQTALAVEVPNPSSAMRDQRRIGNGILALLRDEPAGALRQVEPLLGPDEATAMWEREVRARAQLIAGFASAELGDPPARFASSVNMFRALDAQAPSPWRRLGAVRAESLFSETPHSLTPPR